MEKKKVKIVTIGGGSSYTPELIEGFIKRYDRVPVKEMWLVDVEKGMAFGKPPSTMSTWLLKSNTTKTLEMANTLPTGKMETSKPAASTTKDSKMELGPTTMKMES